MKRTPVLLTAIALLLGSASVPAQPVRSKTADGVAYAMGGITVKDLRDLERGKDDYSLWITTAARGSGAYLSDVQLRITDSRNKLVFNEAIAGPWLFIALPAGRYQVEASFRGQPQKRATQIHAGDRHQMMFYFDSPAEVSPDWQSPFKGSPYSGK